ncbi:MAG: hypothetical protein WDO17_08140 [Alphaproteobacteria bacterium]
MSGTISKDFAFALVGEDALGVVLRCHIEIEHKLGEFLEASLPAPQRLGELSFAMHIRLALGCGLRRTLDAPLKALNKLRNEFAHESGKVLTSNDVERFYEAFADDDRAAADYGHLGQHERPINQRAPRERLVIYCLVLWEAIDGEVRLRRK